LGLAQHALILAGGSMQGKHDLNQMVKKEKSKNEKKRKEKKRKEKKRKEKEKERREENLFDLFSFPKKHLTNQVIATTKGT